VIVAAFATRRSATAEVTLTGPAEDLRGTAVVTGGGSARLDLASGLADVEADVPCTPGTRFQLCSVSKQFVAVAAMLLVESGRVGMHEPVGRRLCQRHPQWRQVTLHHLLSHTAGVPHWLEAPGLDPAEPVRISERLEIIETTPLRGRPGAQWHYSSPGFLLAASIVERASGQPYREFLAERIMSPLELTQTTMGGVPPGAARGYSDGQPLRWCHVTPHRHPARHRRAARWIPRGHHARDQALTARLQALTALRDKLARPIADTILATPGEYACHAVTAARLARAAINWDNGQVSDGLERLREAARYPAAISPDARHPQPLLALAAALIDLRQVEQAEDVLRAADSPQVKDIPAGAALLLLRARIHLAGGRLSEAVTAAAAALAHARALGAHGYAETAHSLLSVIELRRGDLAAATRHLAARATPGPQLADIYAHTETTMAWALTAEARDGPAAALSQLRQLGAGLPARPGFLLGDPALAAWLARSALAAGDSELAAAAARAARALASAHPGIPALAAAAAHSRGVARGDPARLAEAAARHPDPWARASAAEDLGVLHARQGDRDQAIGQLRHALTGYRQTSAGRDQARTRHRLRELGIRSRHWTTSPERPVTGWDSLTDTEQAVAGLVAQGLNNKQVAARMYISSHTVAHHLRQSFRKLGIASRVELTRIVIEHTQAANGQP
jgi:DNA-binding CsgD family transcriptional regulator